MTFYVNFIGLIIKRYLILNMKLATNITIFPKRKPIQKISLLLKKLLLKLKYKNLR